MKRIALLGLFLLAAGMVFASGINEKQAWRVAANFVFEKQKSAVTVASMEAEENVYYLFRLAPKGFVLVAANDAVTPILGYSFGNDFADNRDVRYLLNRYGKEMNDIAQRGVVASAYIAGKWQYYLQENFKPRSSRGGNGCGPLLSSLWDQSMYFNTYCPWDVRAGAYYDYRVPNGCVALAMASILHYYQYPEHGVGGVSYQPIGYDRQTINFGQHTYDYAAMSDFPLFYDGELSKLTWHCGVAVKMGYTPYGSGSTGMEASDQFRNIFKYNNPSIVGPSVFEDWTAALVAQFDKGYPVFYTANNDQGGHAFVLDGYDSDSLIHVNWGWGGASNGFFQADNLDPDHDGHAYNSNERALFNLYPATDYPHACEGEKRLTASFGVITDGSGFAPYPANSNASWMVAVQDASVYKFVFTQFDTELEHDVVTIYNGPTTESGIAGQYSGNELPEGLVVFADSVLVTFTADGENEGHGFVIDYLTVLENPYCAANNNITADRGTISDGSEEALYRHETKCTWNLQTPGAGTYNGYFSKFDLKAGDFVDVYDNSTNPATLLDRYDINNLPGNGFTYNVSKLKVVFVADNWENGDGFSMEWMAYPLGISTTDDFDDLSVFPNPASEKVTVRFIASTTGTVACKLFDLSGKMVWSEQFENEQGEFEQSISFNNIAKGLYFLELENASGKNIQKIILQ